MARNEDGSIFFDESEQKEVDRIVGERLARVKAEKPSDYDDLKEINDEIAEYFEGSTPAERKASIKAFKEEQKAQKELELLQQQAQQQGTSPELLKEIQEAKKAAEIANKKLAEIEAEKTAKMQEIEKQKKADEAWKNQVKEFEEEFPDTKIDELNNNEQFLDFVEGSGWTLKQAYKKFVKIYGEIESKTISKVNSKQDRSTSSGKGGSENGNSYGLSKEQQNELANWNANNPRYKMTPKEFKERYGG